MAADSEPWARWVQHGEKISTVAVVGGTHGNERTGVYLCRALEEFAGPELDVVLSERSSHGTLRLIKFIANTAAVDKNARYVEEDLNRCFFTKDLAAPASPSDSLERKRAREIDALIGPKASRTPKADLVIDLHTTTANTGVSILIHPRDSVGQEVAAALSQDATVNWVNGEAPMLASVGRSGFTLELGAVSTGCVCGELFRRTAAILKDALMYIHRRNVALAGMPSPLPNWPFAGWHEKKVVQYQKVAVMDYPRGADGDISACIHPALQGKDFVALQEGDPLFLEFSLAHRAAGSGTGTGEPERERTPRSGAVAKGLVFSRVAGDCAEQLRKSGVSAEEVYPFFVNEAAYYEKGIALMLATKHILTRYVLKE